MLFFFIYNIHTKQFGNQREKTWSKWDFSRSIVVHRAQRKMYHWFNFSRVLHFILFLFTLEFYKETFRWTTKKLNKRLHNEIARFVQLFIFFFKAQIIVYRSIAIGQPNLFFELGIAKWKIENGKSMVRLNQRMK